MTEKIDADYKGHGTMDREQKTAALEQKTRYRVQMNAAREYGIWDIGHGNSEQEAEDAEQNAAAKDKTQWTGNSGQDDQGQWTNRTENRQQRMRTRGQRTYEGNDGDRNEGHIQGAEGSGQ